MLTEPAQQVMKANSSEEGVLTELHPRTDPRWDEFVMSHPAGTVYHHSAWIQVLAETYGHTPLHLGLLSTDGRRVLGVIPFLFINSRLTGRRLVSLPLTCYCNPLMPEARLEDALRFALGRFPRARYVELKHLNMQPSKEGSTQLGVASPFVSQVLPLTGDIDELFESFHPSCVRKMVRRAGKRGLTFRIADTESELRQFYKLVVGVRRREGLPPLPYEFFANMRRFLSPRGLFEMPVVELNGSVIAAGVVLKGRATWHLEYGAADSHFLRHGVNPLLDWECIKRAHQQGAKYFDFGRTAVWHHSLLEYKDRWGAVRHPVHHRYFPEGAKVPRWHNTSDSFLVRLNKKLPEQLLKWEGRLIYPHRS